MSVKRFGFLNDLFEKNARLCNAKGPDKIAVR